MFWLITALVVLALVGLAWLLSGRARPLGGRRGHPSPSDEEGRFQATTVHRNGGGIGGPLG